MPKDAHIAPAVIITPPSVGTQQVVYDDKYFNDLIENKGYKVNIERALKCPCTLEGAGSALGNCANCGGTKWFFVNKRSTILACTGIGNSPRTGQQPWSETNASTVSITARAVDRLGFMDKITILELEAWFSQPLKVLRSSTNALFCFTTYKPIQIFEIYLWNGADNPLNFVVPDLYTVDYNKIVFDRSLYELYTANEGLNITVRYTHNPVYHVIDVNRDLVKQYNEFDTTKHYLPQHAIARKAHYVLDNPEFNGTSLFNNTFLDPQGLTPEDSTFAP